MISKILRFFLFNRLFSLILLSTVIISGLVVAPFNWELGLLPRAPINTDAIPDIGENQQIVIAEWAGKSPKDVEDQVTFPLSSALLGLPGVKAVRSSSMFGLSSIYVIFEDDVEFYWSRSRILEKLSSLPANALPAEVQPQLGPDATGLGQIFWYTLEETRSESPVWEAQELWEVNEFLVKYALSSVPDVSEVSTIGGFEPEFQIELNPLLLTELGISTNQIFKAISESSTDVGARTLEFNRVEYIIRSSGFVSSLADLEDILISGAGQTAVRLGDIAHIQMGNVARRGGLDRNGKDAVGGAVVARYGSNPREVIEAVKEKIEEMSGALPSKTLENGEQSRVTIEPFYDRSSLISETVGTLESALRDQILVSVIVVLILLLSLKTSVLVSGMLPLGVLATFIMMHFFDISANVVALSGIAIAIGVMVDVAIIFSENIEKHVASAKQRLTGNALAEKIAEACDEVAPAVITALNTTIVSFLPVFALQGSEGKLFSPLAYTKTFALISVFLLGIAVLPTLAFYFHGMGLKKKIHKIGLWSVGFLFGLFAAIFWHYAWFGLVLLSILHLISQWKEIPHIEVVKVLAISSFILIVFADTWNPLGVNAGLFSNVIFAFLLIGIVIGLLFLVMHNYERLLRWGLSNRLLFLSFPLFFMIFAATIWLGFDRTFGWIFPESDGRKIALHESLSEAFPGLGSEFMPNLDEGSFLLMPTSMPHSGVEENVELVRLLDELTVAIPEVSEVVGKWGRANSALDPAPISMFENVINVYPEFVLDDNGRRIDFKTDEKGNYLLREGGTFDPKTQRFSKEIVTQLISHPRGSPLRIWRPHIRTADDIWTEIQEKTSNIPGLTAAPKLQPIQTRLVMLQTGLRAPMGIKIYGQDLVQMEEFGNQVESILNQTEGVKSGSAFADRIVGKPYIVIEPRRRDLGTYGLSLGEFQKQIALVLGGNPIASTIDGRKRYGIRARYGRDFREDPQALQHVLISTPTGYVPLSQLADVEFERGPQMIKSENSFLLSYVIFDKSDGISEFEAVESARTSLNEAIQTGKLVTPAGISYQFAGNFENQMRAQKRLSIVIPLCLLVVFLLLYIQFRSVPLSLMIFSGVLVAFSGGFIMLWLYAEPWFLNVEVFGTSMRTLFQMGTVNVSVAVWVGFIALFGIATDDGVLMGTFLQQQFAKHSPESRAEIRKAIVEAGLQRVRPALMTTATTLIALIPVLTATGKGSDIMFPMAIPAFGGMLIQTMTMFIVPILFGWWKERELGEKL